MDDSEQQIDNETIESNDDEQKAKDKLAQRREARRKKILENAKNRLERLNGRTIADKDSPSSDEKSKIQYEHYNGPSLATTDSAEFSDPEVEPDILPQQMRSFLRESGPFADNGFESSNFLQQNQQWDTPANEFNDLFSSMFQAPPPVQERHILIRARMHIIVSALISCILAIFWRDYGFSIFIPAGLCVITDLLFFREQKPLHPILNIVFMMFSNRLPPQAKNCLHIFSIIQSIIVDLGVFVFSFCTLFYLMSTCLNNNFNDLMVIK